MKEVMKYKRSSFEHRDSIQRELNEKVNNLLFSEQLKAVIK